MNYQSFVVVTDTPARLASFLEARSIIQKVPDGEGGQQYVGVKPGMEWVKVPNPIQTDPGSGVPGQPGYVPPTYDDRSVFLVKFANESADDLDDGSPRVNADGTPVNQYDWSKFGKWVKANSSVVTAPANYLINGQPAGDAYKINGQNVWLIRNNPERFGGWQ